LPAGQRFTSGGDDGWIATYSNQSGSLLLTHVSGGQLSPTWTIENRLDHFSGAGIGIDASDYVWMSYASTIARVESASGAVDRWSVEVAPVNPNGDWSAGNLERGIWSSKRARYLFVRNGMHELFEFDPKSGLVVTLAELPITTSYISRLAQLDDGTVAITGSALGASSFSPQAAVVDPSGRVIVADDVIAACSGPIGMIFLQTSGAVMLADSNARARPIAVMTRPFGSNPPFACDRSGDAFGAVVADGTAQVDRVAPTGTVNSVSQPLQRSVANPHPGLTNPSPGIWLDPGISTLVPDGAGGVWLVAETGTSEGTSTVGGRSLSLVAFGP
jgi:hypothetical protein